MALSMEEQRILAEIERQLAGEDPALAVRLSRFGRPGLAAALKTPRGRVLASFLVVGVVALLSLMVYSLMPLRVAPDGGAGSRSTAAPSQPAQAAQPSTPATAAPAASKAADKTGTAGQTGQRRTRRAAARTRTGKHPRRLAAPPSAGAGPAG